MTTSQVRPFETRHVLSPEERQQEDALRQQMAPFPDVSLEARRAGYERMIAETAIVDGVQIETIDRDGIRGIWIRPAQAPADRVILYLHGGGYMMGTAQAYRGFASQIAARTGFAAFVLDYPLAPEQRFPAAYESAVAARRWLAAQGVQKLALVGDSAGGGLALALLSDDADVPTIAAIVAFSPWTDLACTGASLHDPATGDPIFAPAALLAIAKNYLGDADPKDRRASPLYGIPQTLPPMIIQVGSDELLLDDARRYAEQAAAAGNDVQLEIFEGLHHVFQRQIEALDSARSAVDRTSSFIASHLRS